MCNAFTDFTKDRPEVRELKEEIERLRKEKEWLINSYALYRGKDSAYKTEIETRVDILNEMKVK